MNGSSVTDDTVGDRTEVLFTSREEVMPIERILDPWLKRVRRTHFQARVPGICTVTFPKHGLKSKQVKHLAEVIKVVMGILTYESSGIESELFSVDDYLVLARVYLETHPAVGRIDVEDWLGDERNVMLGHEIALTRLGKPRLFDPYNGQLIYRPWFLKAISNIARKGDIAFLQDLTFETFKSRLAAEPSRLAHRKKGE